MVGEFVYVIVVGVVVVDVVFFEFGEVIVGWCEGCMYCDDIMICDLIGIGV